MAVKMSQAAGEMIRRGQVKPVGRPTGAKPAPGVAQTKVVAKPSMAGKAPC